MRDIDPWRPGRFVGLRYGRGRDRHVRRRLRHGREELEGQDQPAELELRMPLLGHDEQHVHESPQVDSRIEINEAVIDGLNRGAQATWNDVVVDELSGDERSRGYLRDDPPALFP